MEPIPFAGWVALDLVIVDHSLREIELRHPDWDVVIAKLDGLVVAEHQRFHYYSFVVHWVGAAAAAVVVDACDDEAQ